MLGEVCSGAALRSQYPSPGGDELLGTALVPLKAALHVTQDLTLLQEGRGQPTYPRPTSGVL